MNDENLKPVKELTPFTKMIMAIGTLPSSFYASMSYYESMVWLYEYLKNEVIPAVNNNGEAVSELQAKYIELHDYVEHYFDNLDVQEEINKKLDEMAEDGTLTNLIEVYVDPIYQAYERTINEKVDGQDTEISNFKISVNNQISLQNEQIASVESGSPLVASSTAEMTDTTRVYVNTTDGKWYYYDGDSWEIGGTYQSVEIPDGSINITKFDEILNGLYLKDIDFIDLTNETPEDGHYLTIDGNNDIVINNNTYWKYYQLDIHDKVGKLLFYSSEGYTGRYPIIITDVDGGVLFHSGEGDANYNNINNITLIPFNSYYLYIQVDRVHDLSPTDPMGINRINSCNIGFIDNLKTILNYDSSNLMENIFTLDDFYIYNSGQVNSQNVPVATHVNDTGWNIKTYKMNKNVKYKITGYNYQLSTSYVICDNNMHKLSSSYPTYSANTNFTHEFTATEDGFIICNENALHPVNVYIYDHLAQLSPATENSLGVVKIGEGINVDAEGTISSTIDLSNIKAGFTGDSICFGNGYGGGYARILHDEYNLTIQNIAVGGGHITHDSDNVFVISESIPSLANDCDVIVMEGGINDYANSVQFGSISSNYTDTVLNTNFCGAMEKMFRDCYTYFPNKKYVFIIVHNVNDTYITKLGGHSFKDYIDAIKVLCDKYGVYLINICETTAMATRNNDVKTTCTHNGDGLHPNKTGYEKYYIPQLLNYFKNIM